MKKIFVSLIALVLVVFALSGSFMLAHAQVDTVAVGGDPPLPTFDPKTLIWMGATSIGQFLIGLAIKKWPILEGFSNRLIPYTICALATVVYMAALKMDFWSALFLAGATSYATIAAAEGPLHGIVKTKKVE